MAYRRRQGISRSSTFREETFNPPIEPTLTSSNSFSSFSSSSSHSPSHSLAAQAIRASAAHAHHQSSNLSVSCESPKSFNAYDDASLRNETKGFWGVLARKAKAILDDEQHDAQLQFDTSPKSRWQMPDTSPPSATSPTQHRYESFRNVENHPSFRRSLDKITTSLNHIGDTFEKAFEEGKHIVENKTADIKLQIRRKGDQTTNSSSQLQPLNLTHHETQLKASRDVAMATAAKAKLLLRELKSVKADLAFAKQRCSQLEEENKLLRESREKGQNPADDELIRHQLETLLAEKARLAHDNSIYARENRFLREIVEYHQLKMQDVVYVDEGTEEVTEVLSLPSVSQMLACVSPRTFNTTLSTELSPKTPCTFNSTLSTELSPKSPTLTKEIYPVPPPSETIDDGSKTTPTASDQKPEPKEDAKRLSFSGS